MMRSWAGQQPLRLDLRRTALLLVDLQEEQRSDPDYAAHDLGRVLGNAAVLLKVARLQGVAVFHAAYVRDFAVLPPRPFEPVSEDGQATFSSGTAHATAICAEVAPGPNEPVIVKNDASAFSTGELLPLLRERKIEWLVVAGVWTEACVAATIRDAIAQGFRVLLVKDACSSGTVAMHITAVLNLANRLYGGAIVDTKRAIALVQGSEAMAWRTEKPVPLLFDTDNAAGLYALL